MKNIRHYVFALILLLLLWWIVGFQAAIWSALAFCAYLIIKNLGDSFLARTRILPNQTLRTVEHENIWVFRAGSAFLWLSLGVVILSAIIIFRNYGWIAAAGYVVLIAGYGYLRMGE